MSRFVAIVLAMSCGLAAYHFALRKGFENPYPVFCDLVAKKIFLEDEKVRKWKHTCNSRGRLVKPYSPKHLIIKDMNNVLGLLNVSHLEVFDSSAVKNIWKGESLETGIESQFIESELVIFKLHPKSPAAMQGLRKGDVIKTINGQQPNPWEAESESGTYVVKRNSLEQHFDIKAAPIVRDESISFEKMGDKSAVLHVPSFRAEFFSDEKMHQLALHLQGTSRLVVDLRGNIGGNFVAGLRLLSLLMCPPQEVGRLIHPRSIETSSAELPNDLNDKKQLDILYKNREVILKTYSVPSCFKGSLRVLVDSKTSSVAELVAQALKEFRKAPLLGTPSRGQLLVGVWYPLNEVGPGVEISIPEGLYVSHKGHRVEGNGVELDKVLYYDLQEMQSGIDSWVRKALD